MDWLERRIYKEAAVIGDRMTLVDPASRQNIADRLSRYAAKIGGLHMCPRCWLEREEQSPIRTVKQHKTYGQMCLPRASEFGHE